MRLKARAFVKTFGTALGVQDHLLVASVLRSVHQGVQHAPAQIAAAHLLFDGHAANAGDTGRVLDQAACGQTKTHAVQGHGVQGGLVFVVQLQLDRHFLLVHKHLGAQRAGQFLEVVPRAHMHLHHVFTALKTFEHVAQGGGNRLALFGHRVGVHIDQLAGDQQFITPKNRPRKRHGRVAHPVAAHAHIEKIVHFGAGVVLDTGLFDEQVTTQLVHGFSVWHGQLAPIVGHSSVKVHEVVAIEDDLLHVDFNPAHAHTVRKTEILAFHGFNFQKHVSKPGPHRRGLARHREWRGPW